MSGAGGQDKHANKRENGANPIPNGKASSNERETRKSTSVKSGLKKADSVSDSTIESGNFPLAEGVKQLSKLKELRQY